MIIESIKITNFLSHENTEINFEQGVNIITGKNGAGKSSILDAIKFALFAESRNNEKINELIKKGKNFFETTLNFNINGDHYEVYRHFGVKKAKNAERLAYVKKNGVIAAETYEGVNAEITKILNVSRDVFKNSVFVEQGQMDSLISGTPKERKTIFSDIIGLTSLSKSADRIRDVISDFRNESILLQNSSDRLIEIRNENEKLNKEKIENNDMLEKAEKEAEEYSKELEELKKKQQERDSVLATVKHLKLNIIQYNNEIDSREKSIIELRKNITNLQSEKEELEKLEANPYYKKRDMINNYFVEKKEMDNYIMQLDRANDRIKQYNDMVEKEKNLLQHHTEYSDYYDKYNLNIDKIRKYTEIHEEYIKIESNIKSLSDRLSKRKLYIDNFIRTYNINVDELKNLRKIKEEINNNIMAKTSRISEIKSSVTLYNNELKEPRESMETLNGKNRCPLCGTELTREHMESISKEYNNKINKILQNIQKLGTEKKSIETEKEELEEKYKIFAGNETEIAASYIDEINSIENEKTEMEEELKRKYNIHSLFLQLSSENNELEKKIKVLQPYEYEYNRCKNIISGIDIESIKNEINEYNSLISKGKEKIEKYELDIGFVPDYIQYNKTSSISGDVEKLKNELDHAREMEVRINSFQDEIKERNNLIHDLEKQLDNNNAELEKYNGIDRKENEIEILYNTAEQDTIKLKTLVGATSERIKENEDLAKGFEQDAEKYKKLGKAISVLGKIRDSFDYNGVQAIIRKDASTSMTNLTRKYLQSFNLDFDDIAIDENFDIKVTQNSMEQTLESLSGGEKTALAIAIRLSVTEYVLDRISTIIMDEPTNFLDEDRRNNLKDIILYSLKGENIVPQMIMITHHGELISVADASFEVIKNKGTSQVISS
ncbi:AAA family ATPase [Ferroplasma sp.]|uniref:AAA family ATPase n=1 Tax=Ferroplasma sp. TaxID=2591003 RepID=UPI00307DEDDF